MAEDNNDGSTNVLEFPSRGAVPRSAADEAILAENRILKTILINRGWMTIYNAIKDGLLEEDIALENRPDCRKDHQLVVDAIRSLVAKYYGMPHTHQLLSDQMYDVDITGDVNLKTLDSQSS